MQYDIVNIQTITWEGLDILKIKRHQVAPIFIKVGGIGDS
jgi:hypothetical protein